MTDRRAHHPTREDKRMADEARKAKERAAGISRLLREIDLINETLQNTTNPFARARLEKKLRGKHAESIQYAVEDL